MAKTPKTFENLLNKASFQDNPLKYCQAAYSYAHEHNDKFKAEIVDNRNYYEGRDVELEARANDKKVKRSSKFVHQVRPSCDTRFSTALDRLEEDEFPVRLQIDEKTKDIMEQSGIDYKDLIRDNEREINSDMRNSGYFTEGFFSQFYGAEFAPVSILKVSYDDEYGNVPRELKFNPTQILKYIAQHLRMPPSGKIIWDYKFLGKKISIGWMDFDEVLYDPRFKTINDGEFIIHTKWLSWNELMNHAKLYEYDMSKIMTLKETGEDAKPSQTIARTTKDSVDVEPATGYYAGKYLLAEFWIETFTPEGKSIVRRVVTLKNKEMLKNEPSPYPGLKFPFVDYTANHQLGKIEGTPTVSLAKGTSKLYADYYNGFNDALTYGMFGPIISSDDIEFQTEPYWGPGSIWKIKPGQSFEQLRFSLEALTYIMAMIEKTETKVQQIMNAPDFDQATDSSVDEKAVKVRARIAGASRRFRPTAKALADTIKRLSKLIIRMKQQDKLNWLLPDGAEWIIDVPVLSGVYTPDEEREEKIVLYNIFSQSPIFQGPAGQLKLRKLMEDVMGVFRIRNIDDRLPTEEELKAQNQLIEEIERMVAEAEAQAENGQGQPGANNQGSPNVSKQEVT